MSMTTSVMSTDEMICQCPSWLRASFLLRVCAVLTATSQRLVDKICKRILIQHGSEFSSMHWHSRLVFVTVDVI